MTGIYDEEDFYKVCSDVVNEFINSVCKRDLGNIILQWFVYPTDKTDPKKDSSVPIKNIKDIIKIVVSGDIDIQFENDCFIIFDSKQHNMKVKMDWLSSETKKFIMFFLSNPMYYFDKINQMCLMYYSYSGFKFNEYVKAGILRKSMIGKLFEYILSPGVNEKYLDGEGAFILSSTIQDEIAYIYGRWAGESRMKIEAIAKHGNHIKNLRLLLKLLNDMTSVVVDGNHIQACKPG